MQARAPLCIGARVEADAAPGARSRRARRGGRALAVCTRPSPPTAPWACCLAGIRFPKVAQATFGGGLRGCTALAGIASGEPFVTVPRSAALVLAPGQRCPEPSLDAGYWERSPW